MINLPRILGLSSKHARRRIAEATSSRPAARQPSLSFDLVIISADQDFCSDLARVAAGVNWRLGLAATLEEALPLLRVQPMPLVIYDSNFGDESWREALRRLSTLEAHPCILLASRAADEYLRQDVIRSHGYDVLQKGAGDEQLVRSLRFAWHWSKARINKM